MTFACPPEGQLMVEVEGNFLTPDHHVDKGRGEWSTAGALAGPETDSTTKLVHTVYNIKLQSGGQIELGNRIYAATLGARFDAADPGQDPIYSEETTRHLLGTYPLGSGDSLGGSARDGTSLRNRHVHTPEQKNPGKHLRHTTRGSKMD